MTRFSFPLFLAMSTWMAPRGRCHTNTTHTCSAISWAWEARGRLPDHLTRQDVTQSVRRYGAATVSAEPTPRLKGGAISKELLANMDEMLSVIRYRHIKRVSNRLSTWQYIPNVLYFFKASKRTFLPIVLKWCSWLSYWHLPAVRSPLEFYSL